MLNSDKIERYNDNFYLHLDAGTPTKGVKSLTSMSEIGLTKDWSISFFCLRQIGSQGTQTYLISCRNNGSNGWAIRQGTINNNYSLIFQVNNGGQFQYTSSLYGVKDDNVWNHYTLTYKSSSRELSFYINSVFLNTVILPNTEFENFGTETFFGSYNSISAPVRLEGGIRDFTTQNKILNQKEIAFIYYKAVPHHSTYPNIQHYYSLNDRPYESGGKYYLKDVAESYNPNATKSDVELIGWVGAELGKTDDGFQTQTVYKDFTGKYKYNPNSLVFFNNQTVSNLDMTSVNISGDWCFNFRINPYKRPYGTTGARYIFASGTSNVDFFAIRAVIGGTFQQVITPDFVYSSSGSDTFIELYDYEDEEYATGEITKRDITCTLQRVGTTLNVYVNGKLTKTETLPVSVFSTLSNNVAIFNRNNGSSKLDSTGISHISLCDTLTDSQIKELHKGNFDLLNNPSFEYYPSTSINKVIKDLSGNGLDFSYTGGGDSIDTNSKSAKPYTYYTGLNMLNTQSLTFEGLNIGDKLVVNYDENGVTKQDVIDVNAINYTYSNVNTIKLRLATVLSESRYYNNEVYKIIYNNGVLRSGILSNYNEVINSETDLKNPIDDLGVLKFPDLSVNNRNIVANGWANLTDLQNSID